MEVHRKMKERKYEKEDGSKGSSWTLEENDEFIPLYEKPLISDKGKFVNYFIRVKMPETNEERSLQITESQAKMLDKLGKLTPITEKTLRTYAYTNKYGGPFISITDRSKADLDQAKSESE